MTYFEAYLLTRLDHLGNFFSAILHLGVIAIALSLITAIPFGIEYKIDLWYRYFKLWVVRITIPTALFCGLVTTLIPTTKEAAFIYIAPALVNNEDLQKTVKQIPELSNLGLDYLKETLKQETKEIINNNK